MRSDIRKRLRYIETQRSADDTNNVRSKKDLLPGNIEKLFCTSKHRYSCIHLKRMCKSICEGILWNGPMEDIKQSKNLRQFNKIYKDTVYERCRKPEEEWKAC